MATSPRRTAAALIALLCAGGLAACGAEPPPAPPTSGAPVSLPTSDGYLDEGSSRAAFNAAQDVLRTQRTASVQFAVDSVDGSPLRQVLNPYLRLDLRDPDRPLASLSLSILAGNVAVGGKVYRQQVSPDGSATVWVVDPEPKTPVEFALWKPGSPHARVIGLGTEQVAGRTARHYRVVDPQNYAGPTTPGSPTPTRPATSTPSATTSPSATGSPAQAGIGEYDDFWLGEDGTLVRMVSVVGRLRLTSTRIEYGGDVRIDVPDVSKAVPAQEDHRATPAG